MIFNFRTPPPSPELASEIAALPLIVRQGEGLLLQIGSRVSARQNRCECLHGEWPSRHVETFTGTILRPTCSELGYWINCDSGRVRLAFSDEVSPTTKSVN